VNRILIVDDEKDNLQALMRLLRGQFEVVTTVSPFEALKLVQQGAFSVVISDQRMPEMKGVELLEKIKHASPLTTRVLLTGYTEIESVIDAINRGNVYRYIAKPWDPEELKTVIRQADEAYSLRREVEEKNRELSAANIQLQTALTALKQLDHAKHRFLSLISHELNTPLTVMTSFLSLLTEKHDQLGEDGAKAVKAISRAAQRLSDIVAEVLVYIRLDLDGELALSSVDLVALLKGALGSLASGFSAKKIEVKSSYPTTSEFRGDKAKLELAIGRLLTETLQRAPTGSVVKVVLRGTLLEVSRTGEVISLQAFEPLEIAGAVLNHQQSLGLGLALGKMIVEAHGGSVELKSDEITGTVITYRLG